MPTSFYDCPCKYTLRFSLALGFLEDRVISSSDMRLSQTHL